MSTADSLQDESATSGDRRKTGLLRLGTCLCFAGWTWVHFYWEGPYGALLWSDASYTLADALGMDWDEYVGTGANDGFVQRWLARLWMPYLLFTLLALTVRTGFWIHMVGLSLGSLLLVFLSYAKYVAAQHQIPMLVEHGGQVLMPLVLVAALVFGVGHRITFGLAVTGVVTTFAGHGCYACGLSPTPASFHAMTNLVLGMEYETSRIFLMVAGLLDFAICIGIFVPRLRRPAMLYAASWGLLTALARPVAGMSVELNYFGADQFLHEAVLRAPHFILPFFLYAVSTNMRTAADALSSSQESEVGSIGDDRPDQDFHPRQNRL